MRALSVGANLATTLPNILALESTAHPAPDFMAATDHPSPPSRSYDYIIVGGGAAGFVLANQLSADADTNVVLLEAGSDISAVQDVLIPGFCPLNEFSPQVWDYYVTPQKALGGNAPHLAQGYGYGGGTSVNYMSYNRGDKSVFDEWAQISGNDGLKWDNLLHDFKATTQLFANSTTSDFVQVLDESVYGDGPLPLVRMLQLDGVEPRWSQALQSTLNLPQVDFNAGVGTGVSYAMNSVDPAVRHRASSFTAFGLPVAGRSNLHVVHNAVVTRVNLDGKRATSVEYTDTANGNATVTISGKEIILSAGAIGTPKLLMLSGVGPRAHLQDFDIPLILDVPEVGSNLRDHNFGIMTVEVTPEVYTNADWANKSHLADITAEFLNNHTGPLANPAAESFALLRVPADAFTGSDGDFLNSLPAQRGQLMLQAQPTNVNSSVPATTPVVTAWVALVQPEASGTVRLNSSDPTVHPLIDTAYYGTPGDLQAVLWGYKRLRDVLQSDDMKPIVVRELYPGAEVTSDEDLITAIQNASASFHHVVGTAAFGTVVNSNFRVKGLQGLRVVDASVFPFPPNAHTQAAVYGVAHMAARQIREADRVGRGR